MRYQIFFEHADGTEDSFTVAGATIEDVKAQAYAGLDRRGITSPELRDKAWSSEIVEAAP